VWLKSGASKRQAEQLTKCPPTVAVTQQSWRGGNHIRAYLLPLRCPLRADFATGKVRDVNRLQPEGDRKRSFSNVRIASHVIARPKLNLGTAPALPRIGQQRLIFRAPPLRTPKLQRLTSIVFERDRVIFVRPALFARVFVT
jgi:hypothetical protein